MLLKPLTDNAARLQSRLPLVDAFRAVLATTIAWHHFLIYGPLVNHLPASVGSSLDWLREYRWVVQAFFVAGGYVMARRMMPRAWNLRQVGTFVLRRYCRLGLPYLGAIGLALMACFFARGTVPDEVVGPPPTVAQFAAHLLFLQDILGYPSLSAGLWFVCIDFQLGLILVTLLFFRDVIARGGRHETLGKKFFFGSGWLLATASLFYFNLDPAGDVWATYYFAYFFLGVLLAEAELSAAGQTQFECFVLTMAVGLAFRWRWRLAAALLSGLLLFVGARTGMMQRWPRSRLVAYLGLTSYSLFLVHFPTLVVVEAVWINADWLSSKLAMAGLLAAYGASLLVADLFYRLVELPADRLSHRFS